VLLFGQLDATFCLAALRAFWVFIPAMEILTLNQDSFLPKIDLGNPCQIATSEMRKFYTAICAGKWTPVANGQPDWAIRALGEFCRCCGTGLRNKSFGYRGLKSDFSQTAESFVESDGAQLGDGEDEFYEPDAVEFRRPTNPIQFWQALTRGKLTPLDLPVPDTGEEFYIPPTARAYLTIFLMWPEVHARKTVRQIHDWLVQMKAIKKTENTKLNKKGIIYRPYPHNTRTLLNRIGFPLTDKGGAPKTEVSKIAQPKSDF
jgi:hypothetical protein